MNSQKRVTANWVHWPADEATFSVASKTSASGACSMLCAQCSGLLSPQHILAQVVMIFFGVATHGMDHAVSCCTLIRGTPSGIEPRRRGRFRQG